MRETTQRLRKQPAESLLESIDESAEGSVKHVELLSVDHASSQYGSPDNTKQDDLMIAQQEQALRENGEAIQTNRTGHAQTNRDEQTQTSREE
jgi:hypothetical protein